MEGEIEGLIAGAAAGLAIAGTWAMPRFNNVTMQRWPSDRSIAVIAVIAVRLVRAMVSSRKG